MKRVITNKVAVPPNPPWVPLAIREESGGYLNYFYNDDLSGLTVRAVTKVKDNKADPNLETKTYGLFSTCNKIMRKSIVKRGCRYIFFFTNRKRVRVLAGLYLVKWYTPVSLSDGDFCLAADSIWFVENPIPLVDVDKACGTDVSRSFRMFKHVDAGECKKIERLLKRRANITGLYLSEIDRLERFNLKHGGYRYVTAKVKDSYSWDCVKVKSILKNAMKQT
jgi:hypothetical protein